MSTASPLPLQPLPSGTVSEAESRELKQQVANRLAEHRQRRPLPGRQSGSAAQNAMPVETHANGRQRHVVDAVTARFARSQSYRDFLQDEAESAIRQAEAAAEVAMRTAQAVAAAQQQLLDEIDHWNEHAENVGPADVLQFAPEAEMLFAPELVESHPPVAENTYVRSTARTSAPAVAVETPASLFTEAKESHSVESSQIAAAVEHAVAAAPVVAEPVPELSAVDALRIRTLLETAEPATLLPTNLIEFPRQLIAARRARPRLAEGPLRDEADASPDRAQLRIFEVEASSVSVEPAVENVLPDWHNIRLDAGAEQRVTTHADAQISFATPLQVAPLGIRAMAAAVDACCIAASLLMAVGVAAYTSPVLPTGVYAAAAAGVSLVALTVGYMLLFFTLAGATPGMRYARVGLCTFSDENPTRSGMRRRVLALMLACIPMGLGLLWACLDEDGLGWHDRISRMYLREY